MKPNVRLRSLRGQEGRPNDFHVVGKQRRACSLDSFAIFTIPISPRFSQGLSGQPAVATELLPVSSLIGGAKRVTAERRVMG